METIIVLAGNYRQYIDFINRHGAGTAFYFYGDTPKKIAGLRADKIEITGTFWERGDAGKLVEFAKTRLK